MMFTTFRILFYCILVFTLYGCNRLVTNNPPDDSLPPAIPSGLSVYYAADAEVIIDWTANTETDLKGYNIYRSIGDTLSFTKIDFTTDDYYYDDSLSYNLNLLLFHLCYR